MGTIRTLKSHLKRDVIISLGLSAALLFSIIIFIKSPAFIKFIEIILSRQISRPVEIGSLSLENRHRLIISGLTIKEGKDGGPHIIMPHAEIGFSLQGLLKKNIDEIIIERPKLSMIVNKGKDVKERKGENPPPFTFNNIYINEASILVQFEEGKSYNISPVNISLGKTVQKGKAQFKGDAFISEVNSKIIIDALIDVEKFYIEKAHAEVPVMDLEILSALVPLTFLEDVEIKGSASMVIDIIPEDVRPPNEIRWQSGMLLNNFSIRTKTVGLNLKDRPLSLSFKGAYNIKQDVMAVQRIEGQLSRLSSWTGHGTVANLFSGNPDMDIRIDVKDFPINILQETVSGPAVKWLDKIYVKGHAGAGFSIMGSFSLPTMNGNLSAYGPSLKMEHAELKTFSIRLPFVYQENGLLLNDADLNAKKADYFNVQDRTDLLISLDNVSLLVPHLEYNGTKMKSDMLQATSDQLVVYRKGVKRITDNRVLVTAVAEGDLKGRKINIKSFSLDTDSIKDVKGNMFLSFDKQIAVDASLSYENIDIGNVLQSLSPGVLEEERLNFHGTGSVHSTIKMVQSENSAPAVSGTVNLSIRKAGFSSADETMVVEGIETDIVSSFKFPLPLDWINIKVHCAATGFEILMGKFYGDFKNRIVQFMSDARYTEAEDLIKISRAELGLTDVGKIFLSGVVSNLSKSPHYNMEVSLADLSIDNAYRLFIKETFQEQYPVLAELKTGGYASAALSVNGSKDVITLKGEVTTDDMHINDRHSGLSASGINMILPVDISYPETIHSVGQKEFGLLKIADLSWKAVRSADLEITPAIHENAFIIRDDVNLPLFDGSITLQKIAYNDLLSPDRTLGLSIDIKGIDLSQLTASLNIPRFMGSLSGTIPMVSFTENRLLTKGQISLKLFDGDIRINDFSIDNVTGPIASIKSSIEMHDINLEKLTGTFDFGHISGILEGKIDELVIANGQAQSFRTSIETVKKKGIDQRINVDALKKISILGAGSATSILDRGIYQLFKQYGYEKIGFKAYLRNDNLLLLGVKSEEGKQYLVDGGLLPPKVDVVAYSQNISYKELVDRLKRIGATEQ